MSSRLGRFRRFSRVAASGGRFPTAPTSPLGLAEADEAVPRGHRDAEVERRATAEIHALEQDLDRARATAGELRRELALAREDAEIAERRAQAAEAEVERLHAELRARRPLLGRRRRGDEGSPLLAQARDAEQRAATERRARIEAERRAREELAERVRSETASLQRELAVLRLAIENQLENEDEPAG